MGDYHSFGSMKFVPELESHEFKLILERHPLYNDKTEKGQLYTKIVKEVYPQIEREIFAIQKPFKQLGFPEDGGVTSYFSNNMNKKDLHLVHDFLEDRNISILNTRAFKVADGHYLVTVGSVDKDHSKKGISYKNQTFDVEYGEFGSYLEDVIKYLKEAEKYAANDKEIQMLQLYEKHF